MTSRSGYSPVSWTTRGCTQNGQDQGVARVVLVEPYYGGSHRAWADGLVAHSRHEIHLVTHYAAYWRCRLRRSALSLAAHIAAVFNRHPPPASLLATDMVHLAALVGFLRRDLGDPAVALYLHENQLTHPVGPRDRPDEGLALANWLSMAVADRVFVNSDAQLADLRTAITEWLAEGTASGATGGVISVSYTHLRAHETPEHLVCRLLLEKKKTPLVR